MRDPRRKPAPSAVAPARYQVGAPPLGALGVSSWHPAGEGSFAAPLGDSPQELAVRVHEYGHLHALRRKLHPNKPDAVLKELERLGACTPRAPVLVQVAVDCYTHGLLWDVGLGTSISALPVRPPQMGDAFDAVRALLQSRGTDVAHSMLRTAREALPTPVFDVARRARDTLFRKGLDRKRLTARHLAHILAPLLLLLESPDEVDQRMAEAVSLCFGDEGDAEGGVGWGECEVLSAPLAAPRRVRPTRGFRAGYVGAPVFWARLPPAGDGAVFRSRRPTLGGTVLIDVSGSMRLTQEDVERIVAAAPGAVVAVYASYSDLRRGAVTVVAKGGRVANIPAALAKYGIGNVVDGPALEWLGRQPGPRIWISDGDVTGVGDSIHPALYLDAMRLCRKYGIRRVEPERDSDGRLILEGI
jgi:hypothetical protein